MAIATIHTYLMKFPDTVTSQPVAADLSKATKVIDITDFPDLGGEPEKIEVTTLSDDFQKNINGVQSMDSMTFTANYELDDVKAVKALENKKGWYGLFFGADATGAPDGHNGVFVWQGELTSYVSGGGTNEAVKLSITSSCETKPTLIEPAAA